MDQRDKGPVISGKPSLLSLGGPLGGGGGGALGSSVVSFSVVSFSLDPPLATTSSLAWNSFDSWCTTIPNRSLSRLCHITLTCSLVAPSGTLAMMSYRSVSSHPGPL